MAEEERNKSRGKAPVVPKSKELKLTEGKRPILPKAADKGNNSSGKSGEQSKN